MNASIKSASALSVELPDKSPRQGCLGTGLLVINADDWGRNQETTDRIHDCVRFGSVSAVSAMVFMEDSERAAEITRSADIDAGLHLNLTTPFSAKGCDRKLIDHQHKLINYLRGNRFARYLYNPFLRASFEYVVAAQLEEFQRLYVVPPARIDGHHHIHLCPNVMFQNLLPAGTHIRRNFSLETGEKNLANRAFRSWQDRRLAHRHHLDDYFFSLPPLEPPSRVQSLMSYATRRSVEIETHPVNAGEFSFLMNPNLPTLLAKLSLPFPLTSPRVRYVKKSPLGATTQDL